MISLCSCLCWVRLPVWTRGWAVWVKAAWWAAQHRHWWHWWKPGSGSPSSQKNLNWAGGPGPHPREVMTGYCKSQIKNFASFLRRCLCQQCDLTVDLEGRVSRVGPPFLCWGENRKKDGVWAWGLAGIVANSRWHVWAAAGVSHWGTSMITSCLISVIRCFKNASHPASVRTTDKNLFSYKRGVSGARFWPAQ